jgi:uncharacterized protein YkwD
MFRRIVPLISVLLVASAARAADADLDEAAHKIVERTNRFRQDQKRDPLKTNEQLTATARDFAAWMAKNGKFAHDADGKQPWDRAKAHGYEYCEVAENIAYASRETGFDTDQLVTDFIDGWEKSPGHRKNMLDPDLTEIGVGVARSAENGAYYGVQVFGRPRSLRIEFRVANRAGTAVKYKVGDQNYELQPRMFTTHELCKPADMSLLAADGSVVEKVRPANGERFAVTDKQGLKLIKD